MKACIIMPVHNEAPKKGFKSYLGNSIKTGKKILKKGIVQKIIIVDDGSTDGTGKYIKKRIKNTPGIIYIRLPKNVGKAKAFLTGLEKCALENKKIEFCNDCGKKYEMPLNTIITMDADIKKCPTKEVSKVIRGLKEDEFKEMAVGLYKHENGQLLHDFEAPFSGLRAISMKALECIYDSNHKDYLKIIKGFKYNKPKEGYRLEAILDKIIPLNKRFKVKTKIVLRDPGEGNFNIDEIHEGVDSYYKN